MGYNGYLIKIGTFTFPLKYIEYGTYKVKVNGQDIDSFRNANGILTRNALEHMPLSISFDILDGLDNETFEKDIMKPMRDRYENSNEKDVTMEVFVPEINGYITQKVYKVDTEFTIDDIEENLVYYDTVSFEFVRY